MSEPPPLPESGSEPIPLRGPSSPAGTAARRRLRGLADAELLALLLAAGTIEAHALRLAHHLLSESGGLAALPGLSCATLRHHGLSMDQAAALLAGCELARRLARDALPDPLRIDRPDALARYLLLRYQVPDQEVMGAAFLDANHYLLADREIFRGTLHRAAVEPRQILKECLLRGAAGVVLFHTHATRDPAPSAADLRFTVRMAAAAAVVGVELVDHLVLAAIGRWVSLRTRDDWPRAVRIESPGCEALLLATTTAAADAHPGTTLSADAPR